MAELEPVIPEFGEAQVRQFQRDGFLIFDSIIDANTVERLRTAMASCFEGHWQTGLAPDEVNWKPGQDPQVTRQLCNVWKSNTDLCAVILAEATGKAVSKLNGWSGARLAQDNLLWKPPADGDVQGGTLGMHQDSAFAGWASPSLMCTVWIALDDVSAQGGTLEFAKGSHKWAKAPPISSFHNPEDYRSEFMAAAAGAGVEAAEIVHVEVPAGGGSIHHGWTWHGSGPNGTANPRRSVVSHCLSSEAEFTDEVGYIYSRYKPLGSTHMDEAFFPILWSEDHRRSPFIAPLVKGEISWHGAWRR